MRIHAFSMLSILLSIFVTPNHAGPFAAKVAYQVMHKACTRTSTTCYVIKGGVHAPQIIACGAGIAACETSAANAARRAAAIPFI